MRGSNYSCLLLWCWLRGSGGQVLAGREVGGEWLCGVLLDVGWQEVSE